MKGSINIGGSRGSEEKGLLLDGKDMEKTGEG
jgi:hypothetical protein